MMIAINNRIHIRGATPFQYEKLKEATTVANPRFLNDPDQPEFLTFYSVRAVNGRDIVSVPLGIIDQVAGSTPDRVVAMRPVFSRIDFNWVGSLFSDQEKQVSKILGKNGGILVAPTGSGKTVIGLAAVARLAQPAIWITPSTSLISQTREKIAQFMRLPENAIGIIDGSHKMLGSHITVATWQSSLAVHAPR